MLQLSRARGLDLSQQLPVLVLLDLQSKQIASPYDDPATAAILYVIATANLLFSAVYKTRSTIKSVRQPLSLYRDS